MTNRLKILFVLPLILLFVLQHLYAEIKNNISINELVTKALSSNQIDSDLAKKRILEKGKDAVPELLDVFNNANYSERKTIGSLIIQIGADAVPDLELALLGENEDLAANSAILLGEIGNESISSLQKVFKEKKFLYNLERKMEAAYALSRIGPDAYPAMLEVITGIDDEVNQGTFLLRDALTNEKQGATTYLIKALKDSDPVKRLLAAIILGEIRDDSSVPALIEALNDQDRVVCTQVALALGNLGNRAKQAAPFIIKKLNELENKEPLKISENLKGEIYVNFTSQAIYTLKKINAEPEDVLPMLIRYMKHNDSIIRSAATEVVGQYQQENVERIEALIQASNDIKGEVRKKAIESFERGDIRSDEVVRLVLLKLNDPYASVRGSAAKTLGKFREEYEQIIPRLISALKDENAFVRGRAAASLGDFRDNAIKGIPVLIEALKDSNHDVRLECVKALGKIGIGSKETISSLKMSFITENSQIQNEAANALKQIGLESVPVFLETLKHDNEVIRKISAERLGDINPKAISAVPDLIIALHDESSQVIEASAKSLGNIGPGAKTATSDLISLLNDRDYDIRKAAINALGNIGPDAADSIPKLIELLIDSNFELQNAVINTLGKFGVLSQNAVIYLVKIIENGDFNLLNTTINALGKIGPAASEAVPILIKQLKHEKRDIRAISAQALGFIGSKAKTAIPPLLKALYDEDGEVKYRTADALADISKDLSDKKDVSMIDQLEEIARHFKSNTDMVTERYPKNEHYKTLIREINHLKTLRILNFLDVLKILAVKHPYVTVFVSLCFLWIIICHIILWVKPLKLLSMNEALGHYEWQIPDWLGGGGLKIKLRYILYFGFLNYRNKVLNEWVLQHINIASNRFKDKGSVKLREIYIPMPVSIDNTIIQDLTQTSIIPAFRRENCCILISGEGGLGKTSLAFQIAKWAISKNTEERFFEYPMIPVLIENDLEFHNSDNINPLMSAILFQLQDITDSPPISQDFAYNLIRKKRVLVIIDHLSEMNRQSKEAIIKELRELKINSVIVTSRIEESLGGITKTLMKPLRIAGEGLVVFIAAYLNRRNKRELFNNREFLESCHNFSSIIGESPIIFAKFYAEQLIAHKENPDSTELPKNLPDLMLSYLNDINRNVIENRVENRIIHRDAKILAWESLKESFIPSTVEVENALLALGDNDAEDRLVYLENRLMLIETIEPSNDRIRFLLDPLAEYLASLYAIENFKSDETKWRDLLGRIKLELEESSEIKGFINAIYECLLLKGKLFEVPDFVFNKLENYFSTF